MANKMNRKCVICGAEYSYCPKCGKDLHKPTWMNLFDNENCKNIYTICTNFRDGVISGSEAREQLSKCNLNKLNDFSNGMKQLISNINNSDKETVKENKEVSKEEKSIVKEGKKFSKKED